MQSLIIIVIATLLYFAYDRVTKLQYNIAEAKKSGLPYIVARNLISLHQTYPILPLAELR